MQNRLLFDHNLWGLLKDGDEKLQIDGDPSVTIIPNDDATEFTLDLEDGQPIHLSPDLKPRLVDTLITIYKNAEDGDRDPSPLVSFRDEIRENRVRMEVAEYLGEMPPFSNYSDNSDLEITENGWLFHGELLLTWECEFRHPNTQSTKRDGSIIEPSSADSAYDVSFQRKPGAAHAIKIDGESYRLTDNEMDFLTKAIWAAEVPAP